MAAKSVSFNTVCNLYDSQLEAIAKWLSCNGEIWGLGPTAVFASAAVLFLYNELEATVFLPGDQEQVSTLEKTLISSMMLGMLALMIHLWVCSMRFFQYYLDTIIRDSPNMLLEMTTIGLLGGQSEMVPLGPLTRFLRQQQPQIHITVCWFLSLCYADYVRKNYCQRFNMPYLEQWQTELQDRVMRTSHRIMEKVNSFVGSLHQQLRGYGQVDLQIRNQQNPPPTIDTESPLPKKSSVVLGGSGGRVSWSDKQLCDSCTSGCESPKDRHYRLIGQSSDTIADAITKLRNYVKVSTCPCGCDSHSLLGHSRCASPVRSMHEGVSHTDNEHVKPNAI